MRKKIQNFENYEVDETGRVFNIVKGNELKGSISEGGYKYFRLSLNGTKKMFYGHRLVAEAFIPNPDNLPVVNHKDGNKLNNSIENLEWVTYSENISHAHKNSLIKKCEEKEYYEADLEGEEWLKVTDYNYSISSKGRVRNDKTNLILKPSLSGGYYKVRLSKDGDVKDFMVHKLVYSVFNNEDYLYEDKQFVIDHIDGNKINNAKENLRKLSLSDNVMMAYYEQNTNQVKKTVYQYDLNGVFIDVFPSTREAGRQLNLDASSISKVCRGILRTCGGFKFSYSDK